MPEKVGANAYINFKGTSIAGDFREFKPTEKIGLAEASAGADAAETFLKTLLSGGVDLKTVWQDTAAGDATYLLCAPGAEGSLIFGPNGSTAGMLKVTVNAISEEVSPNIPYKDVMELDIKLRYSGAPSRGTF
jgi:hypothetical protein